MRIQKELGYYRQPTILGDDVTFVCEDDLWRVSASGGTARRLTANPGSASFPAASPDGRWIAFTSSDDGPLEVYVMPSEGGTPVRLTWFGAMTQVVGWTADSKSVLFATNWRQPFMKSFHLYQVSIDGGSPDALNVGPARAVSHEPGGEGVVIGRNSADPARWKRYRGGTAGTLWIDRAGDGRFRPFAKLEGNLASPMWVGDRIYFLSDHEGCGNLYSAKPTGRDLVRHTDHQDYYLRYPASDGKRIVHHAGADLFLFDCASGQEQKIDIRLGSPRPRRKQKYVDAEEYLESFDLHPKGHSIATVHRGGVYTMGLWEGAGGRHADAPGVRHRLATWSANGTSLFATSDTSGDETLVQISVEGAGNPRPLPGKFGRPASIVPAPEGPLVAITNERHELFVLDTKSKKSKRLERSEYERMEGLTWSPDGRWLAYSCPTSHRTSCIRLYDSDTGKITNVTRPEFKDVAPAFDDTGTYLYFISYRIFDPIYDSHTFDLGFPRGSKPFLIPLRSETCSPFSAAHRTPRPPMSDDPDDHMGDGKPGGKKEKSVQIDLDGIADRVVAFPVAEGLYGRIAGVGGNAFFTSFPAEGSLEVTWMPSDEPLADGILEVYDFEKQKAELVTDRVTDFQVAMDAPVIGVRTGNRLKALHASHRSERREEKSDEPGRESGWLDLHRLRIGVDPGAEWRQMFGEAWRLQRDHFWTADMAGLDWQGVKDRYLPLVDRCASRSEFSDLMWEMQGELGTSHCYELGGDYRLEPDYSPGLLGADVSLDAESGTWRVSRIPRGDSWNEGQSSPLAAPGVNVKAGDEILAVDGVTVGKRVSLEERMSSLAGEDVRLTVRSGKTSPGVKSRKKPSPGTTRTVTIRALGDETPLRYRDWVETNRALVHEASKGRVGYVHIPNMGPLGYAEFHRYYIQEVDNDGLLIDVRFNGGGHVSQLLLEKLLRKRIGYGMPRWGSPDSYPEDAPRGPMVALTNEYAGSDGDIFSHAFKLYGLGPLLGKRTWGGVVGIWPRASLVDGTVTTQAEYATWFNDVGWGVENYGTDPDIDVEILPQDYAAGRDPQIERAIKETLKLVRSGPRRDPKMAKAPSLRPARLQKRKR